LRSRDIIVVGASAGGVQTLSKLAAHLPGNLPAAVFVVQHFPPRAFSVLPAILNRAGPLLAQHAEDKQRIVKGRIYVAPPDHHLMVHRGYIRLVRGPKENNVRPAIDVLFRSAARAYGARVTGVVLTGTLDDGSAGLVAIQQKGGATIVQDPEDALYDGMPRNALQNVRPDYILPADQIGQRLMQLAQEDIGGAETEYMQHSDEQMEVEVEAAQGEHVDPEHDEMGEPSVFTCPECHGTLWEVRDGDMERYRCRVGHAYSMDTLADCVGESVEAALYAAVRALEEKAALSRRMAKRAAEKGQQQSARRFDEHLQHTERQAEAIRSVLHNMPTLPQVFATSAAAVEEA
jgi:two-component system, chemotaxis family, protein-glutamate methylesterase/glutaminase